MTVTTTITRAVLLANGTATSFPFNFPVASQSDLQVTLFPDDGGAPIPQAASLFSVVMSGVGGTVVFLAPPPANYTVVIERVTPVEQPKDFRNQGKFYPESHERAFDRSVMQTQELADAILRAISVPFEPGVDSVLLPLAAERAGGILSFDQDGRIALLSVSLTNDAVTALWQMSGNGVTTVFAIPGGTSNTAAIYFVTLNGVRQTPTVDYTVADEQITFTTPPGPEIESILVQVVGSGAEGQKGEPGSSAVFVSPTPPDDPFVGMLWLS